MSVWDNAIKRKNLIAEELEEQCQRFSKIIKCSESSTITLKNHFKNQSKATESTTSSKSMANPKKESDMISTMMGQYLLKGYTLLDEYCNECQTPMMRRKFDPAFCISCDELKGSTANSIDRSQPENLSTDQNKSDNGDLLLITELDNTLKQVLKSLNQDLVTILDRRKIKALSFESPNSLQQSLDDIVSVLNVIDKTVETRKLLNQNPTSHV